MRLGLYTPDLEAIEALHRTSHSGGKVSDTTGKRASGSSVYSKCSRIPEDGKTRVAGKAGPGFTRDKRLQTSRKRISRKKGNRCLGLEHTTGRRLVRN